MPEMKASDGVILNWSEHGSGEPTLLLVHGYTGNQSDWNPVVDRLSQRRRVITYDHRGHGASGHSSDTASYSFDVLVADLECLVDELGLTNFDLLGHSMGGVIAMRFAIAHPERLRSLVLMDTGAAPSGRLPRDVLDPLIAAGRDQGMQQLAATVGHAKLATMDVEALAGFGDELERYPSMLPALAQLSLPVTVLVGEDDSGLRAAADTMAATIPRARLEVIPAAGHSPQEDNPAAWLESVERHLSSA
jgi:pimeloyl-ACP methyl ester carboxylesterase